MLGDEVVFCLEDLSGADHGNVDGNVGVRQNQDLLARHDGVGHSVRKHRGLAGARWAPGEADAGLDRTARGGGLVVVRLLHDRCRVGVGFLLDDPLALVGEEELDGEAVFDVGVAKVGLEAFLERAEDTGWGEGDGACGFDVVARVGEELSGRDDDVVVTDRNELDGDGVVCGCGAELAAAADEERVIKLRGEGPEARGADGLEEPAAVDMDRVRWGEAGRCGLVVDGVEGVSNVARDGIKDREVAIEGHGQRVPFGMALWIVAVMTCSPTWCPHTCCDERSRWGRGGSRPGIGRCVGSRRARLPGCGSLGRVAR